ncbi:hypothetical protein AB0G79_20220 [Streptomyces sp. NPDC020807]|uniref:hypothetical protein n=1 Tax=Streptomyces sp. NPDC020807 TaxID=3155119 RepID=UPI0033EA8FB6
MQHKTRTLLATAAALAALATVSACGSSSACAEYKEFEQNPPRGLDAGEYLDKGKALADACAKEIESKQNQP